MDEIKHDGPSLGGAPASRVGRPANARHRRAPVRHEAVERDDGHSDGARLTRTRKRSTDPLYIDKKLIPPGTSYEWKAEACYGEKQQAHVENLRENHWREVPADRHPGVVVKQNGMVLMERPLYLTKEAQLEDYQVARDQAGVAAGKMRETPEGQMTRDHPSVDRVQKFNRDYEPISVPQD